MSGKADRPFSASPGQAPAPLWRGSGRRCGWWPWRSWFRKLFLGPRIRNPPDQEDNDGRDDENKKEDCYPQGLLLVCCLQFTLNRFPGKKKYFRNKVDSTSQNLHKTFSQSYQNVPQLLCIVECDSIVLEQSLVQHGLQWCIVEHPPQKLRLHLDFSSFDLAHLLWMAKVFFDLIFVEVSHLLVSINEKFVSFFICS